MRNIEPGMKFVYKSKYNGQFYIGIVCSFQWNTNGEDSYILFMSDKGIYYRSDEVEWLDEIRDEKLKELGV